ncbi:Putative transposase (identified by ISEscan HMM) [Klebsiella pneumoniae]|nr:Putative transposase (identified by ISEscan HMM) [Klebsiella pneumoniae]
MKSVVMLKTISKKPNTTWRWVISLKSFWANEAVFQMMMLSYNLFLLFKFDSLDSSEYRQQIKTFRLKYVFLAAKIIKTARYVIMKLSENYPYKGVYEKCLV